MHISIYGQLQNLSITSRVSSLLDLWLPYLNLWATAYYIIFCRPRMCLRSVENAASKFRGQLIFKLACNIQRMGCSVAGLLAQLPKKGIKGEEKRLSLVGNGLGGIFMPFFDGKKLVFDGKKFLLRRTDYPMQQQLNQIYFASPELICLWVGIPLVLPLFVQDLFPYLGRMQYPWVGFHHPWVGFLLVFQLLLQDQTP